MAHKQAQYTHMDVSYELYRDGLATGGITTVKGEYVVPLKAPGVECV